MLIENKLFGGTIQTYTTMLASGLNTFVLAEILLSENAVNSPIQVSGMVLFISVPVILHVEYHQVQEIDSALKIYLDYSNGIPGIESVFNVTQSLEISVLECTFDVLLTLPDTVEEGDLIQVTYYADNTVASKAGVIEIYSSIEQEVLISYQVEGSLDYREFDTLDFHPLECGMTNGFLFIAEEEQVVSTITFKSTPESGILYNTSYIPVHVMARVTDKYNNPVPNLRLIWQWSTDGVTFTDFVSADNIKSSPMTDYEGQTGILIGNTFLDAQAPETLTLQLRDEAESTLPATTYALYKEEIDTYTGIYLTVVASFLRKDEQGYHYTVGIWEEGFPGTWGRIGTSDQVFQLFVIDPSGLCRQLVDADGSLERTASTDFKATAVFQDTIIVPGTKIYATRAAYDAIPMLTSNLFMVL